MHDHTNHPPPRGEPDPFWTGILWALTFNAVFILVGTLAGLLLRWVTR